MTKTEKEEFEYNAQALLNGRALLINDEILQLDYKESSKMDLKQSLLYIIEREGLGNYKNTVLVKESRSKEEIELYKLNRELQRAKRVLSKDRKEYDNFKKKIIPKINKNRDKINDLKKKIINLNYGIFADILLSNKSIFIKPEQKMAKYKLYPKDVARFKNNRQAIIDNLIWITREKAESLSKD